MRSAEDIARTGNDGTGPVRTCVGCRARAAQSALVRIARADARTLRKEGTPERPDARTLRKEGTPERPFVEVVPDPLRRLPGRGAYVHPDSACIHQAVKRGGLARALRTRLDPLSSAELQDRLTSLLRERDSSNLSMHVSIDHHSTHHHTGLTPSEPRFVVAKPELKGQ